MKEGKNVIGCHGYPSNGIGGELVFYFTVLSFIGICWYIFFKHSLPLTHRQMIGNGWDRCEVRQYVMLLQVMWFWIGVYCLRDTGIVLEKMFRCFGSRGFYKQWRRGEHKCRAMALLTVSCTRRLDELHRWAHNTTKRVIGGYKQGVVKSLWGVTILTAPPAVLEHSYAKTTRTCENVQAWEPVQLSQSILSNDPDGFGEFVHHCHIISIWEGNLTTKSTT